MARLPQRRSGRWPTAVPPSMRYFRSSLTATALLGSSAVASFKASQTLPVPLPPTSYRSSTASSGFCLCDHARHACRCSTASRGEIGDLPLRRSSAARFHFPRLGERLRCLQASQPFKQRLVRLPTVSHHRGQREANPDKDDGLLPATSAVRLVHFNHGCRHRAYLGLQAPRGEREANHARQRLP